VLLVWLVFVIRKRSCEGSPCTVSLLGSRSSISVQSIDLVLTLPGTTSSQSRPGACSGAVPIATVISDLLGQELGSGPKQDRVLRPGFVPGVLEVDMMIRRMTLALRTLRLLTPCPKCPGVPWGKGERSAHLQVVG